MDEEEGEEGEGEQLASRSRATRASVRRRLGGHDEVRSARNKKIRHARTPFIHARPRTLAHSRQHAEQYLRRTPLTSRHGLCDLDLWCFCTIHFGCVFSRPLLTDLFCRDIAQVLPRRKGRMRGGRRRRIKLGMMGHVAGHQSRNRREATAKALVSTAIRLTSILRSRRRKRVAHLTTPWPVLPLHAWTKPRSWRRSAGCHRGTRRNRPH